MYTTCLGYLLFNNPDELRVGIVYTLYTLYQTQPLQPKVKINISIELYEELCKIEVLSRENKVVECFQIIQSLKQQKCLNFTASVRIDPLLSSLVAPKEASSQLPQEIIEENTLKDIDFEIIEENLKSYEEKKKKYTLDTTLFVINPNFSKDLKLIKENHIKEKKIREENLEIEKTTEPVKKRKSTAPRVPRKKKQKEKEKAPISLLEKAKTALEKIEKDEEDEEEEEVKEVKKKRKRKKEIEVIPSDLINQSIDEFLFSKQDKKTDEITVVEVIEESSNIAESLKKNPRKRKVPEKF